MKTTFIYLATFLLVLTSCRKDDDAPQKPEQKIYLTKIVHPTYNTIITYDSNNRIATHSTHYNSSNIDRIYTYTEYDNAGNPVKANYSQTGEPSQYVLFTYDSNGRISSETYYLTSNNGQQLKYSWIYDASGYTLENYNASNSYTGKTVYSIFSGNVTNTKRYSASNVLSNTYDYTSFDSKNSNDKLLPIHMREGSSNNYTAYSWTTSSTTSWSIAYEYNADNFPTKRTATNLATNATTVMTYEYIKK